MAGGGDVPKEENFRFQEACLKRFSSSLVRQPMLFWKDYSFDCLNYRC